MDSPPPPPVRKMREPACGATDASPSASASAGRFARSPQHVEGLEVAELRGDRLADLGPSVPNVRVPQTRGAVEIAAAVGVVQPDALAAHDDQLAVRHR